MYVLKTTLVYVQFLAFIGYGVAIKQATLNFKRKAGKYLPNSVIATKYAESESVCSMYCTRLDACVSVNYKARGVDQGLCQLNNRKTSEKLGLVSNDEFVHLFILKESKAEMKEIGSKCSSQKVCTSKPSCKELLDKDSSLLNGTYHLQTNASTEKYPVYCHMAEIPGCGTGAWTLVMKTNGSLNTFTYDSPLWANKEGYAVEDGLEGLTEKESKLASYWNTPFKKICLGMIVNSDSRWMALDYEASSLYSLIANGKYRSTTAGRTTWMSVIAGSSLQPYCNHEGFNIHFSSVKARLGLVANNQNDCLSCDSWIGFGVYGLSCSTYHDDACGNRAVCADISAFGYILVQ